MDTRDKEIYVKPDLELDQFLEFIMTSLKCPDIVKLEIYDDGFERWLKVKETKDLKLSEGNDLKFKVTFSVSGEVCIIVILSM